MSAHAHGSPAGTWRGVWAGGLVAAAVIALAVPRVLTGIDLQAARSNREPS